MTYQQETIKPYDGDESKRVQVERMFDHIAPTYDRLNHTLSLGIDRWWRKQAIGTLTHTKPKRMLDVATGTGDFALLAYRMLQPENLVGCDISAGMMDVARQKTAAAGLDGHITFAQEDVVRLSFNEGAFDAVTVAFGVRNFEDLDRGLAEMRRVLADGGKLVVLELSTPERFPMKQLYRFYSRTAIPAISRLFGTDRNAYRYLPASIQAFPQGEVMEQILYKAGFRDVRFRRLTFGLCTLYVATK